jgi:hypothetical protein
MTKDRSGQAIIQAMIAMSILMVGVLLYLKLQNFDLNAAKMNRLYVTRDRLAAYLSQVASMRGALRVSSLPATVAVYPTNQQLQTCINGGTSTPTCDSSTFYDFYLLPPTADVSMGVPGALSGISGAPVAIDFNGKPCQDSTCSPERYPFLVETKFRPICRPNYNGSYPTLNDTALAPIPSCRLADFIEVHIKLYKNPAIQYAISTFEQSVYVENILIENQ